MFIVELTTTTGKVSENFATYEEALRRVEHMPAEALVGMPLIFEELVDGSERLVRYDGKPLQWHRLREDRPSGAAPPPDGPLPLDDALADRLGAGQWRPITRPPEEDEDEPLPLV
jgi:hypothetical protein